MKTSASARRLLDLHAEYTRHDDLVRAHAEFGTEPERTLDDIAAEYEEVLRDLLGIDAPLRTAIYGSCVARDVLRVVPDPFEVTGYIARQSWVSAFTPPVKAPDLSHVKSAFQARNIRGDFESNAGERLTRLAAESDIVLIDIASDRHGVAAYEGGYVSLTPDHRRAFKGIVPGGRMIPFGSDEHLTLFRSSMMRAAELLLDLDVLDKTYILEAPFTDRTVTGEPMVGFGETAEEINVKYKPYYNVLGAGGFQLLPLPEELAVADHQHQWGPGQDHYADPAYHWWAEQIEARARGREAPQQETEKFIEPDSSLAPEPASADPQQKTTLMNRLKGLLGHGS